MVADEGVGGVSMIELLTVVWIMTAGCVVEPVSGLLGVVESVVLVMGPEP